MKATQASIKDSDFKFAHITASQFLDDETGELITADHPSVRISLLKLLYNSILFGQFSTVFAASILAIFFWITIPSSKGFYWLGAVIAIATARILAAQWFQSTKIERDSIGKWEALFNTGVLLMGLAWSAVVIAVIPEKEIALVIYTGLVLCAVSAGAVATLAPRLNSFALFLVCTLVLSGGWLIVFRTDEQVMIGMLLLILSSFMYIVARRFNEMFVRRILLEKQAQVLIRRLRLENTRVKKIVSKLAESEEQYRDLFDNASDLIQSVYPDGRIAYVNKTWLKTLGYNKIEFKKLKIFDIIHPDSVEDCKKVFAKVFTGEDIENISVRFIAKNGQVIDLEGNANCKLKDGKPHLVRIIFRNVTQRKKMELSLKESEEQYRSLVNNANDMIFTVGLRGRFLFVNTIASELTGYSEYELLQMTYPELVHPTHRKKAMGFYKRQLREGIPASQFSFPIVTKNGEIKWLSQNTQVVIKQGEIIGLQGVARDVTEQMLAQEALIESETGLRAVLDNIVDAVITIDSDGIIENFNSGAERIFGYKAEEIIGKNINTIALEPYGDSHVEQIHRYVSTGKSEFIGKNREVIGLHRDGRQFPLMISLNEMSVGGEMKFTGIARDISEQKKAYDVVLAAKEEAVEIKVAEERFISTVSHEIRTPMNAVIGFIDLLSKTQLGPVQDEYVKGLRSSSERLLKIVNDLLEFKRIQAGKIEFVEEPFDLKQLLETLTQIFSIQANIKNIGLEYEIDDSVPLFLTGDETRLSQVLQNLISNAIKYTDTGKVSVSVELVEKDAESALLQFTVKDNGVGIPPGKLDNIFNAYQQVEAKRDATIGTGLGLSIIKTLVESQNGEVFVNSIPNRGSEFGFILKFAICSESELNKELNSIGNVVELVPTLGPLKLLLVDDEPMNIFVALKFLEEFDNIKVDTADNGLKGLDLFRKNEYDIILTDMNMPEMGGDEFIHHVRNDLDSPRRDIPVIALTAENIEQNSVYRILAINNCILKPFTRDTLYQKIYETLLPQRKHIRVAN